MMKMKKKIMSLILAMVMCLMVVLPGCAFAITTPAAESDSPTIYYDNTWELIEAEDGTPILHNPITNRKIIKSYRVGHDGQLVEVDLSDYLEELNNTPTITVPESTPKQNAYSPRITTVQYIYSEKSKTLGIRGEPLIISSELPARQKDEPITVLESVSVTNSYGGDITIGAQAKEAISTGASFSWSTSLNSEVSVEYGLTVPQGYIGRAIFIPYFDMTEGTLTQITSTAVGTTITDYNAWGLSPQKTALGYAYGRYDIEIVGTC